MPLSTLVPGDLLQLAPGDAVPADVVLVGDQPAVTAQLTTPADSAPLTRCVTAGDRLQHGAVVVRGEACAVVCATGVWPCPVPGLHCPVIHVCDGVCVAFMARMRYRHCLPHSGRHSFQRVVEVASRTAGSVDREPFKFRGVTGRLMVWLLLSAGLLTVVLFVRSLRSRHDSQGVVNR